MEVLIKGLSIAKFGRYWTSCRTIQRVIDFARLQRDVRANIFQSLDFFLNFNCSQILQKNWAATDLVSEITCVENFPDLEKLTLVIQHGLATGVYSLKYRR